MSEVILPEGRDAGTKVLDLLISGQKKASENKVLLTYLLVNRQNNQQLFKTSPNGIPHSIRPFDAESLATEAGEAENAADAEINA